MRVFLWEAEKLLIYQKGLLYIILYMAFVTVSTSFFSIPKDKDMLLYGEEYHHYLGKVEGKLTKEGESFLKAEAERLSQAGSQLDRYYEEYYDGKLSAGQLAEKTEPMQALLQNKNGFEVIFGQYTFVRENPADRYFLDTNGWNALLDFEYLDIFMVLLLLLLVTPVFAQEQAGKMEGLLLMEKKGAAVTAKHKMHLVMVLVSLLCLFTFTFRYFYLDAVYGLDHGEYPFQSLAVYDSSVKSLTLLQAYFILSLFRSVGYLLFSMTILLVSVLAKKSAVTLFLSTGLVIIPYFGISSLNGLYYFAFPLNFMLAAGFLKGSELRSLPYSQEQEIVFSEVSCIWVTALFLFALLLVGFLYLSIWRKQANMWSLRRLGRKHRSHRRGGSWREHIFLGIFICILPVLFGGCGSEEEEYQIYNMAGKDTFENQEYLIKCVITESKSDILFENKVTGETGSLIRNPLQSLSEIQSSVFGNGRYVYYARYDMDKSGLKPGLEQFSIIQVNTDSFEETLIFEKNIREMEGSFWGIRVPPASHTAYLSVYGFFLDQDSIFLIVNKEIMQIDRLTGSAVSIPITGKGNIAYDGRHLFYINETYQLVKHDVRNGSREVFTEAAMEHFYVTEREILYRNRRDQDRIYGMDPESGQVYKISDRSVLSLWGDEKSVYFTDKTDGGDYRIDRDERLSK